MKQSLAEAAQEWGIDPKGEMYKLPAMHVGAYAERDAEATLGLWQELKKEIINQDLEDIFDLETELFPCLVDMRFQRGQGGCRTSPSNEKRILSKRNRHY